MRRRLRLQITQPLIIDHEAMAMCALNFVTPFRSTLLEREVLFAAQRAVTHRLKPTLQTSPTCVTIN